MTGTVGAVAAESFDEAFWPLFLLAFKAAFRVLRETAAAEDVAADVLGRLHVRWARLGHVSHRDAWVVRAATNGAIDVVRRGRPPAPPQEPTAFEDEVASRLLVASALRRLSRRQREVLGLLYLVGLSEDDTAGVLGIGGGSVRRHAARGLERLRRGLDP
ncbi:MAG TPA: sigma factor-like helix-turn-helix DNA-binding protein [Acidimicrobiales bacterium]|nr:sigma factor-like helix-turn-helix DNA-binding protein [Acidimicrobiales bacterium]